MEKIITVTVLARNTFGQGRRIKSSEGLIEFCDYYIYKGAEKYLKKLVKALRQNRSTYHHQAAKSIEESLQEASTS